MTMSLIDLESPDSPFLAISDDALLSMRSQVIVAEVQGQQLAFPCVCVDEVLLFPRQQIIQLPFYQKPVVGMIPHQGSLTVLVDISHDSSAEAIPVGNQNQVRALRLNQQVGELAGAAILIDRIVGTMPHADMHHHSALRPFNPEEFTSQSFQPYRWA